MVGNYFDYFYEKNFDIQCPLNRSFLGKSLEILRKKIVKRGNFSFVVKNKGRDFAGFRLNGSNFGRFG